MTTGAAAVRVSIVTPFLNAGPFIAEAIDSVLAQSFRDWELLLVDDGSSDGSTAIAHAFAAAHPERIRYLCHDGRVNKGASASRNLGTAAARTRCASRGQRAICTYRLSSRPAAMVIVGPVSARRTTIASVPACLFVRQATAVAAAIPSIATGIWIGVTAVFHPCAVGATAHGLGVW